MQRKLGYPVAAGEPYHRADAALTDLSGQNPFAIKLIELLDMISYRKLTKSELPGIADIDRSEIIRVGYEVKYGKLIRKDVVWDTPDFILEGEGAHTISEQVAFCRDHLERNGISIGAFDHDRLVGIGVLTPNLRPGMAQLAYLYVSAPYRRMGIATELACQLIRHARKQGANRVYVSATPSESAVDFYRSIGFDLIDEPLPELFELEPEDIHMVLELGVG
ncbi:MAG: GNAT family N-acetyltransferase [Anaerolineales bacterium]|jgi:predicted N-acetyltransferase YhbS